MPSQVGGGPDSWEMARKYAKMAQHSANLFSSCIRTIKTAEIHSQSPDSPQLRELAQASASFLVGVSPSIKAILYFAARSLHPENLKNISTLNSKALLNLFSPSEIASILGLTFVSRHVRKHLEANEYGRLEPKLLQHLEISTLVGQTVSHIGKANGMLIGGMRMLAWMTLAIPDLKGFQDMRRALDRKNLLFDLKDELDRWGCTHLQIASALLCELGFGLAPSLGMAMQEESSETQTDPRLAEEILCWRIALMLSECFHQTGSAPLETSDDSELYLPPDQVKELESAVSKIIDNGPAVPWLIKRKADLPEEIIAALDIREIKSKSSPESDESVFEDNSAQSKS
jgi:hypothetical protein